MTARFNLCLLVVLFSLEGVAAAQSAPFADSLVQSPEQHAPARGSVTGQYASVAFGSGELSRGSFSLPLPVAVPNERGGLQASPFPSYSPEAGISEWGVGFQTSTLAITRTRIAGDLDYATDDLSGPWGRMIRGTDGFWYPEGLRQNVRMAESGDELLAYLPDGSKWTFGASARVVGAAGTYAWYLKSIEDVLGRSTNFTYASNTSGRLFLVDVSYGGIGAGPEYTIHFDYEPLSVPFTDYRSGAALVLDQRVRRIEMVSLHAGAGTERWHYLVGYKQDAAGPAFYLTSLQQVFASGATLPALTYDYGTLNPYLASAAPRRVPKLDALFRQYGADVIQPSRSTSFDADDDGRPDLELGYDNRLLRQTDTEFTAVPLPAIDPTRTEPSCRRAALSSNAPRLIARGRSQDTDYSVLGLVRNLTSNTTTLAICSLSGEAKSKSVANGDWTASATTKFADLNRDHEPDLVHVFRGGYQIIPNGSTDAGYAFGDMLRGTLSPSVDPDSSWVHDFNGDGLSDLIARTGSSLIVWLGKGNFQYETGRVFQLVASSGLTVTSLSGQSLTFIDANGDGLTDVLLNQGSTLGLFLNSGTQFKQVKVPAFAAVNWLSGHPVALDLDGSGNPALAYAQSGVGFALDLTAPGVGLLLTANDGQGTVLGFSYAIAAASPGARLRHRVLASLSIASTGYDTVTRDYSYGTPALHSSGHFLLGFEQVTSHGALETETTHFSNGDYFPGLFASSTRTDELVNGVVRVTSSEYDDATSFGIPWKRKRSQSMGWQNADLPSSDDIETTLYQAYSAEVCPTDVMRVSSSGTLTTQTELAQLPALQQSLSCLPARTIMTGGHSDPSLDFRHEASFERNEVGQLTRLVSWGAQGDPLEMQSASYDSSGLLASVATPGTGTTTAEYVPGTSLLRRSVAPDGVVTTTDRDALTDAVLATTTDRGGQPFVENYRYDGQERLLKAWNNLGLASEALPNESLSYRLPGGSLPGLIHSSTLIDASLAVVAQNADLSSATGESLARATLAPEGWVFSGVTQRVRSSHLSTRFAKPTRSSIDDLDVGSLFADAEPLISSQSSAFGPLQTATRIHDGVVQSLVATLTFPGSLQRAVVENQLFTTDATLNSAQQVTQSRDAEGNSTRYTYDVLGRLRRVQLADGTNHRIDFDERGRTARVDRDGVASVTYGYDPVTGLLLERDYLAPPSAPNAGVAIRRVIDDHDAIGRVVREIHFDDALGDQQAFSFYYDGSSPAAPDDRSQLGSLTAVTGDRYARTMRYRPDGSVASSSTRIADWRQVDTEFRYTEDGQVRLHSTVVRDAAGEPLIQDSEEVERDAFGRAIAGNRDGKHFSTVSYDANGQPSQLLLDGAYAHGEVATLSYDPLTRAHLGTKLEQGAWSSWVTVALNDRGLIDNEAISLGDFSQERSYSYTPQGTLASSKDRGASYDYTYDSTGLPTHIVTTLDGSSEDRALERSGTVLTAGAHHHTFDALGRAIERDDVQIVYGANGQVSRARRGDREWEYIYDEAGTRIAKLVQGVPTAAYLQDGSYLNDESLLTPVVFAGTVLGVMNQAADGTKQFQLAVTDPRGSLLSEADLSPNVPSPFGERAKPTDLSAALDYATKGWDADLGVIRMGMRDYDPALARFLTADPLYLEDPTHCVNSAAGCTLYAYANDNPVSNVDPTGLDAGEFKMDGGSGVTPFNQSPPTDPQTHVEYPDVNVDSWIATDANGHIEFGGTGNRDPESFQRDTPAKRADVTQAESLRQDMNNQFEAQEAQEAHYAVRAPKGGPRAPDYYATTFSGTVPFTIFAGSVQFTRDRDTVYFGFGGGGGVSTSPSPSLSFTGGWLDTHGRGAPSTLELRNALTGCSSNVSGSATLVPIGPYGFGPTVGASESVSGARTLDVGASVSIGPAVGASVIGAYTWAIWKR